MSETKKELRKIDDVRGDYNQLAFKAGAVQYQIFALNKDLALLNNQLLDLNLEAAAIEAAKASETESKEEAKS